MENEYQRLNSFNRETLLSGESSSIVGSLGQSRGDEPEGICLPQVQVEENSVPSDLQTQEISQTIHQTTSEREVKDPLITDKAEQSSYNKEQIEKIDENIQDWFSNTGVTAVLITFFQGHIRILAPDHMSPLKGNQDFKQIFLTTLFKNVPATKGKEKLNNVIEEGNEIIENRLVNCEKCGRAFKSENHLRGHRLLVHMSTESPNHKCEKCGKTFQAAAFLQTHLCNRTGRRDHECKVCGTRFTTEGSLKIHSRIHTDEKPFKCPTCGQSFPRRSSLNYHIAKHTGEKQYKCSTCDKQFVLLNNLRDHERIHSGERPFSCQECGKSFTVSSTLRRHLLVHSGEKPYQCDKCNGRFTRLVHLQSHMRIHSGERPYKCDGCDKSFAQSSHLRRHQKIHDRERTRPCDKCGKELSGDQLENGIQHSCTPVPEQNFRQLNFQFCAFDKQFGQV